MDNTQCIVSYHYLCTILLSSIKCHYVTAYWYFVGSWSKGNFSVSYYNRMISVDGLIATLVHITCLNRFILWTCTAVSTQWCLA